MLNKFLKKRKAQITAFILIGIIILATVWGVMVVSDYFSDDLQPALESEQQLNLESETIKQNIDSCVRTLTDKGVQFMSDQGMYFEIPEGGYEYDDDTPYWIKDTINIMPHDFEAMEYNLSSYVNNKMKGCVSFKEFRRDGWTISELNTSTRSNINEGENESDITVEVYYTITVKKENFERVFSNSIYNPNIRFRQMFIKANHFINDQLLRPDLDIDNPLEGYNSTGYSINYTRLDDETLLFLIADGQSKNLDGRDFTLKFAASFDTNSMPRIYDASNNLADRTLYSPDRLATLILPPGTISSSDEITIQQYETDSVTTYHTPIGKKNSEYIGYSPITYDTMYPIYRFTPDGTTLNPLGLLTINLNEDQKGIDGDYTLLYNGANGWVPYPHEKNVNEGTINAVIFGFSEYTAASCADQSDNNVSAEAEEDSNVLVYIVVAIVAIVLTIISFGGLGPFLVALAAMTYGSLAASAVILAASYMAYTEYQDLEGDKTIVFSAICDDTITIIKREHNGDGTCTITAASSSTATEVSNGQTYTVTAGQTYTLESDIEVDWYESSGSNFCSVTGLIAAGSNTTNSTTANITIAAPLSGIVSPTQTLVCCVDPQGYCHDNYLDAVCNGNMARKSCSEVPECSSGSLLDGSGSFQITDINNTVTNFGREGQTYLINYHLPSGANDTQVIAHIKLDGTEISQLNLFDDGYHEDQASSDKYYANRWDSTGMLGGLNSGEITWDIEVIYMNEDCGEDAVTGGKLIDSIGSEETVSSNNAGRSIDIDVDSLKQPHIVTEMNSVGGGLNSYHKVGSTWNKKESLLSDVFFVPHIEVDQYDRAWIQSSRPLDPSQRDYDVGHTKCCDAMSIMETVSTSPSLVWGPYKVNSGFVASMAIDPYTPDKAYQYNHNGKIVEWSLTGTPTVSSIPSACCGGESGSIEISPRENQQGVFHTVAGGYYRNQLIPNTIEWIISNQWTDHTYVSVGVDLEDPSVAYLTAPVNRLSLNIWDGDSLLYPNTNPYIVDSNAVGESAQGGSQGRIPQSWASAIGGGAFLCWTSSNGINIKYITHEGESSFGPTTNIGPGSQCAIETDSNGDIHMTYNNGGVKYRKITTKDDSPPPTPTPQVSANNREFNVNSLQSMAITIPFNKNWEIEAEGIFSGYEGRRSYFGSGRNSDIALDTFGWSRNNVYTRISNGNIFFTGNTNIGTVNNPMRTPDHFAISASTNLEDGQSHKLKLIYDFSNKRYKVAVDGSIRGNYEFVVNNMPSPITNLISYGFTGTFKYTEEVPTNASNPINQEASCILNQVTISDVGYLFLIGQNTDCEPIANFNMNSTLDISFASNNYNDINSFATDVQSTAARIMLTEPFASQYAQNGINFYQVDKLFATDDLTQINTHTRNQCDFSNANTKMTLVLNHDNVHCNQEGFIVEINPLFVFNTTKLAGVSTTAVMMDFCSYVNELAFIAPPVATILTPDINGIPAQIDVDFTITDEEFPIDYELLFNYVTLISSTVNDSSTKTHVLDLPNGNWIIQIKATDQRGNVGYSNILKVDMNDTMTVDFSSIDPVNIAFGDTTSINLDSFANDPRGDSIEEWLYNPPFSTCFEINPYVITDGNVQITHIGSSTCEETFEFTAVGSSNRMVSDELRIIVN